MTRKRWWPSLEPVDYVVLVFIGLVLLAAIP